MTGIMVPQSKDGDGDGRHLETVDNIYVNGTELLVVPS